MSARRQSSYGADKRRTANNRRCQPFRRRSQQRLCSAAHTHVRCKGKPADEQGAALLAMCPGDFTHLTHEVVDDLKFGTGTESGTASARTLVLLQCAAAMNRRTRWKELPLKCRGFPIFPTPFSPVSQAYKMLRARQIVAVESQQEVGIPADSILSATGCITYARTIM